MLSANITPIIFVVSIDYWHHMWRTDLKPSRLARNKPTGGTIKARKNGYRVRSKSMLENYTFCFERVEIVAYLGYIFPSHLSSLFRLIWSLFLLDTFNSQLCWITNLGKGMVNISLVCVSQPLSFLRSELSECELSALIFVTLKPVASRAIL